MAGKDSGTFDGVLSQADDVADRVLRHSKHYLPHLARLCLIATFLEDGLRMWFQWTEQKDYVNLTWHCGETVAHLFVLVNMLLQVGGCVMVLVRRYVTVAVGLLFGVIVIQVGDGLGWGGGGRGWGRGVGGGGKGGPGSGGERVGQGVGGRGWGMEWGGGGVGRRVGG